MKQLLRSLYDTLTYRNAYSDPAAFEGLLNTHDDGGVRTVHHSDLPAVPNARRRRILQEGLSPVDWQLMDLDTARLLLRTAAELRPTPITSLRSASEQPTAATSSRPSHENASSL